MTLSQSKTNSKHLKTAACSKANNHNVQRQIAYLWDLNSNSFSNGGTRTHWSTLGCSKGYTNCL